MIFSFVRICMFLYLYTGPIMGAGVGVAVAGFRYMVNECWMIWDIQIHSETLASITVANLG